MPEKTEDRIETLLDQLENPALTSEEIVRIEKKVRFLQSLNE